MPAGGRSKSPFRSGTKNPMGKDRVRDRKIKKISQMMEKKSPYLKDERPKKPSLPPKARGTGGFRKPTTSKLKIGALSNRKKVNK